MNFKGIFKPPAVPITNSPIKVAGPGRFSVGRDGIEITAYQADARAKIEAAMAIALLSTVAGILALAAETIFAHVPPLVLQMVGGALGGLLYFAVIAGREKHLADRPVQMVIPWTSVGTASRDLRHPGGVVVEVKGDSAQGTTRRTLHFHPADGTDELLCAIRERPLIG